MRIKAVYALIHDGAREVLRRDELRARNAERVRHRPVDDTLVGQRRIEPRVPECGRASGAVALRAIRIKIRTDAVFERRGSVRHGDELVVSEKGALVERRVEDANVVPRSQLVVRHPGAEIGKIAIELARLEAEHVAGSGCVATQTVLAARIKPLLRARAGRGLNDDVLVERIGK